MKKLLRTRKNRIFSGVLGGIAEYFGIDATLVRLVFVVLLFLTVFVPLFCIYIVAIFIIPNEDDPFHSAT
ncbi:PspC domain-containing protein [Radiobacillus kanasensis]|uniref:PspC domain-containing protein n=1 Tax=Radiobacillus kanasensis TaxID=2844358 RepID=UPI001E420F84|nr:PspC domain-containing protein [Radiobacillus kanasensis]UFT98512.1 PspC domain-containing protein [Radiobacillus kanasensis]